MEIHDSISNHNALQIDGRRRLEIILIDKPCQIGNIFPRIRFASDEEGTLLILAKLLEEIEDRIEVIIASIIVIIVIGFISIIGESNTSRRLDKQQIRFFVP